MASNMSLADKARERFAALDVEKLEQTVRPLLQKDLLRMKLALAGLGLLLGWVQVLLLSL